MNPKDIARMITEDPDVIVEGICSVCGSEADVLFNSVSCSNPQCRNYDSRKMKAMSKPDLVLPYTLYDDDDYEVGVNVDHDEGISYADEILWAVEKKTGRIMDGDEFTKLNEKEGIDAQDTLDEMVNDYYEEMGPPEDIDAYKRKREDALLDR